MGPPIRVVMFGSGPVLTHDAQEFLCRLEEEPEIALVGAFCQGESSSIRAVFADLVRRRGVLAIPLFLAWLLDGLLRQLRNPTLERRLRAQLSELADRIRLVSDIHGPEVLEQVADLEPDLGLVYGSPILRPELFELPDLGTLGIHHGRVPDYRGNKTTFWAMYNGENSVGVTIQKINEGLDTGEILAEGSVEVGGRSLREVLLELEELGLDLYIESVLAVRNGTATLRPQSGPKRKLYRNPTLGDLIRFRLIRARRRVGSWVSR